MESRRRKLSALLSCLIVFTASIWAIRESTAQPESVVVYIDMALTGKLIDRNAAERVLRQPLEKVRWL